MLRYSKNIVCDDYIQYQIVYSHNEIDELLSRIYSLEDDKKDLSYKELIKDEEALALLKHFTYLDIISLNDNYLYDDSVEADYEIIGDIDNDKEIIIVYSCPFIYKDMKFKFPRFKDVYVKSSEFESESLNKIDMLTNLALIRNGFCIVENGSEVTKYSDVYIKILFSDILISSEYIDYNNDNKLLGKKLNENIEIGITYPIKLESKFEISKIINRIPSELTNEVVQKLDYDGAKTIDEFKNKLLKNDSLVCGYKKTIDNIYDYLKNKNKIYISKITLNHYDKYEPKFKSFSNEEKYDIIRDNYTSLYIYNMFKDKELNSLNDLKLYYKLEYKYNSLLKGEKANDFFSYLRSRIEEGNLYLYVKNNKENNYDD